MSNEQRPESLPYMNELSGGLLDAVEQVCNETHADAALERALSRACQLETPAFDAEVEEYDNLRARSVLLEARHTNSKRRVAMITRIATAVIAVAGITSLFTWFSPGSTAVAFAEVQGALEKVRSVTFDATSQVRDQPESTSKVFVLGAGRVRVELADGEYIVHDPEAEKSLIVKQQSQTAVVITGRQPNTSAVPTDLYSRLRRIHAKAVKKLPGKTIEGVEVSGFLVEDEQKSMQIWIDPGTDLPVYVESTRRQADGVEIVETGSNFNFDIELDESLFSTEPPTGYAVETVTYPKRADSAPEDSKLVISPKIGLGTAQFGMPKAEVIEQLGRPDFSQANAIGGETLRYDTRGFWVSIGVDGKLHSIVCHAHPEAAAPVARTFAGKTSDGLAMGASRNDISRTLGPPSYLDDRDSEFGKFTTMSYWDLGLEFSLRDDSLIEIHAHPPKSKE